MYDMICLLLFGTLFLTVYWSCGDKVCYITGAVLLLVPFILMRKLKSHQA